MWNSLIIKETLNKLQEVKYYRKYWFDTFVQFLLDWEPPINKKWRLVSSQAF